MLALSLLLGAVPSFAGALPQVTVETDISKVQNLASRTNSDENIVRDYMMSTNQEGGTVNVIKNEPSDGETVTLPNYISVSGFNATNGIIDETHADYNVPFLDTNGEWTGNTIDIVFNLLGNAKIDSFLFAGCSETNKTLFTEEYAIFASNDFATLYDDENKIYHYENTAETASQYYSFSESIEAKFFGIRIYKGVTQDLIASNRPYSGARIRELAIFGSVELSGEDLAPDSPILANKAISELKGSSNLSALISVNTSSEPPKKGSFLLKGSDGENVCYGNLHNYTTDNDVIDGSVDTHADLNTQNADGIVINMEIVGDEKRYIEGVYYDAVLALKGESEVEKIFIAHAKAEDLRTYQYDIYISENYESLFEDANKKFSYVNENKARYQTFLLNSAVTASFVGVRIHKAVPPDTSYGVDAAYPRIAEIAVFGKYEGSIDISDGATDKAANDLSISQLKSDYNLASDISEVSTTATVAPGQMIIMGYEGGLGGYLGTANSYSAENDVLDLDANTHADISCINAAGKQIVFMEEVGGVKQYKNGVYMDITLALREKAMIDKFFISHHSSQVLRTYEYEVYMSDSYETLYNSGNKVFTYVNEDRARYQTFSLPEKIEASFVGVRITKAVPPDATNDVSALYPRIGEIAVFGEYSEGVEYTLKSNEISLSESGKAYKGEIKSFSMPLVKDGYSFDKLLVDGEETEVKINHIKNTASVKLELSENTELNAVYKENPVLLSGFSKENGFIKLPRKTAIETKESFDGIFAPALDIVTTDGDPINETAYIETGDKVSLIGGEECEIITEFDYDLSGSASVTDIVAAVDGILKNSHEEKAEFSFDGDENGKLTVTDAIMARNSILSFKYIDYSYKTSAMDKVPFKGLGRYELNEGVLNLEMSASGFSFNAYLYGDVKAVVENDRAVLYYAVYLDGERVEDVAIKGSEKGEVTLLSDLPVGYHNIEIVKQFETMRATDFKSISINGEFGEKPANKELLIDFVGDSITCGYGNLMKNGENKNRHEDGTKAYGFLTAQKLGADWAMISRSGATVVDVTSYNSDVGCMPKDYEKCSTRSELNWNFERKADIVVINLGTNDNSRIPLYLGATTDAQKKAIFEEAMLKFAKRVAELNGKEVKIVFAFGLMSAVGGGHEWIIEAYQDMVEELSAEGYNVYFTRLTARQNGGASHPDANDADLASDELVSFLKSTVLN